MEKSAEQDKILPAILAARLKIDPVLKDKLATVRSDKGNYTYGYAGAHEFVMMAQPPLLDAGLFMSFDPKIIAGEMMVVRAATATEAAVFEEAGQKIQLTGTIEHVPSGQFRSVMLDPRIVRSAPGMNAYQALGASVTYLSGILVRCLLGMSAMDDDTQGQGDQEGKKPPRSDPRPTQQPHARGAPPEPAAAQPAAKGPDVKVAPECLDSYESAMQVLDEKIDVGGKPVPLFMADERKKYVAALTAAARDMGRMAIEYATIMNAAEQHRSKIEGGK